jgi:hypothetical protein
LVIQMRKKGEYIVIAVVDTGAAFLRKFKQKCLR